MQFSEEKEPGKRRSPAHRHEEVKMLGVQERKKLAAAILADGLIRLLSKEEGSLNKGSAEEIGIERRAPSKTQDKTGTAGENGDGQ